MSQRDHDASSEAANSVPNNSMVANTSMFSQGSFARSGSFALDIGAVSTEQLAIKFPLGTAVLDTDVERTSKYIKSWSKRHMRFDETTRTLSYSRSRDEPTKGSMVCKNIIRLAEQYDVNSHDPSLFAVTVEGLMTDGKEESWRFRLLSESEFFVWYNIIRRSIAAAGLMEPIDYGLPDIDPRNSTRFTCVPLDHLRKFILLERAILYYFGQCTMYTGPSLDSVQRHILAVGDRCVYIFRSSSDVVRCVPFPVITGLMCPSSDGGASHFIVIKCEPNEHDLVIEHINDGRRVCEIIAAVQNTHTSSKRPVTLEVQDICKGMVADFVKANGIQLLQPADYVMKPISPTPKSKLKAALDLYTKEHGTSYLKTSSSKRRMSRKSSSKLSTRSRSEAPGDGPALPGSSTATAIANAITSSDPLLRLLGFQGLVQYIDTLVSQHVDVSLLSCMDPVDLANFGVTNMSHATRIVEAAKEREETGTTPRPSQPPSTQPSTATSPQIAPTPNNRQPSVVDLDDDLDMSPTAKPPIVLDDDSDDELLPSAAKTGAAVAARPPSPQATSVVNLSDSDDLDIPLPPKGGAPPAIINIADDDDI